MLALNGGSSSIRFALYEQSTPLRRLLSGKVDRVGTNGLSLEFIDSNGTRQRIDKIQSDFTSGAVGYLLDWLELWPVFSRVNVVGHRVVHGMLHTEPQKITAGLLKQLHRITPYAPEHLPRQIAIIEAIQQRFPALPQAACFDTAFHQTMPRVATLLPIPRRFEAVGVRRYGFHGLSYQFLMNELTRLADPAATSGRVILAHLGNGASMTAVRDGISIDTSMGFTTTGGLVMGSRSGDLDPGLLAYLASSEQMNAGQLQNLVSHESGLLGVSETSPDMRDLLAREDDDVRAAEAVELFCYQAKKWIGSFAAVLGGLDMLVFTGGIGENSALIRTRICAGLDFLGIELDSQRNEDNVGLISTDSGRVKIRVIRTDEESMIASSVLQLLNPYNPREIEDEKKHALTETAS